MSTDLFTQPPYDRALALLRQAGQALPEGLPGDERWTRALVWGLVHLAERARGPVAAPSAGEAGFDLGPPYVGEVSAAEKTLLFVELPEAAQEPLP